MFEVSSNFIWHIICTIVDKTRIDYHAMKLYQSVTHNRHLIVQSGYTLIELMIVIAIIVILAAIATVSYQVQLRQSQVMIVYQDLHHFILPYQILINEGSKTIDFSANGLNMPKQTKYCQFTVKAPIVGSDTTEAVICNIQNLPYLQNQSLSLTFTANGNWECKASSAIPASYLPQACRP